MSDLPHPTPPAGMRFKGHALRLLSALLAGLVVMLLGGVIGVALVSTLIAAAAAGAAVWLCWLLVKRLYLRTVRRPS